MQAQGGANPRLENYGETKRLTCECAFYEHKCCNKSSVMCGFGFAMRFSFFQHKSIVNWTSTAGRLKQTIKLQNNFFLKRKTFWFWTSTWELNEFNFGFLKPNVLELSMVFNSAIKENVLVVLMPLVPIAYK